ncbi:hypothetical protein WJX74_010481 [Apatococcus lobatus]|uniref:Uncharacterized protein n=1 Tax=Apatococcus lobatus TaxID=904363 RepID=A0AAW1REE5_9CHLO
MTTRASLARGQGQQHFEGRVRKWEKRLTPATPGAVHGLWLLKWQAADEASAEERSRARYPHLIPVEQPVQLKAARTSGKRSQTQALDTRSIQAARPAPAITEPPPKRIRFQDAAGQAAPDTSVALPRAVGADHAVLKEHGTSPEHAMPLQGHERHDTQALQGLAHPKVSISDVSNIQPSSDLPVSQSLDTANGVTSSAADDSLEGQHSWPPQSMLPPDDRKTVSNSLSRPQQQQQHGDADKAMM